MFERFRILMSCMCKRPHISFFLMPPKDLNFYVETCLFYKLYQFYYCCLAILLCTGQSGISGLLFIFKIIFNQQNAFSKITVYVKIISFKS